MIFETQLLKTAQVPTYTQDYIFEEKQKIRQHKDFE